MASQNDDDNKIPTGDSKIPTGMGALQKNPQDFSEFKVWELDQVGAHITTRNVQTNIYDYLMEPIQNAIDSQDEGKPNFIEVNSQSNPITVIDHGGGITKYHDENFNKFINYVHATSAKMAAGLERKGIGMFQYPKIAPYVVVTSMDSKGIYRIPITIKDQLNGFGKWEFDVITEENKKKYGIQQRGTINAFWDRPPFEEKISSIILRKKVRERWSLRLYRNPLLVLMVDGKRIRPEEYMYDHPPKYMFRLRDVPHLRGKDRIVTGNIWLDTEKGNGQINLFQNGYLVTSYTIAKQCRGYLEIPLGTNSARSDFERDTAEWLDFIGYLREHTKQFPNIAQEREDKHIKNLEQTIAQKLGHLLRKTPTSIGGVLGFEKSEMTGTVTEDSNGEVGYRVSPEPDPDREIKEREFKGRDIKNVGHVTLDENGNPIKSIDDKKKKKKNQATPLHIIEKHMGEDKPLLQLYLESPVPILFVNKDNAEYPYYRLLHNTNTKQFWVLMDCLFGEIEAESRTKMFPDPIRMMASHARVQIWKNGKVYPTATMIAEIQKARTASAPAGGGS